MDYEFTLAELAPVTKIELVDKIGIRFWFEGEETKLPPMKWVDTNCGSDPGSGYWHSMPSGNRLLWIGI